MYDIASLLLASRHIQQMKPFVYLSHLVLFAERPQIKEICKQGMELGLALSAYRPQ